MCIPAYSLRTNPSNFIKGLFRCVYFVTFVEISYCNCITSCCGVQQVYQVRGESCVHQIQNCSASRSRELHCSMLYFLRAQITCVTPDVQPLLRYYLGFRNYHQTYETFRFGSIFFLKKSYSIKRKKKQTNLSK